MKIGLIDVDGHNFPNLALMKISRFHKYKGDAVEWVNHFETYDKVYLSKVFTFTPDIYTVIQADEIIRGGTGYDATIELPPEIDNCTPDYSLYPGFSHALGFITRGCPRKCEWCIVPKKEGNIYLYGDIKKILNGRKSIVLMDNNILALKNHCDILAKIIEIGCAVDFNQGLDARLLTDESAKLLSKIKWIRYIRFAYDTKEQLTPLLRSIELLNKYGVKNSKIFVYCLLREINDSYERIDKAKELKINPFAQPYHDFTSKQIIPQWQLDMSRWCNDKAIFKMCDFKDYNPRKGFYCREYFNN